MEYKSNFISVEASAGSGKTHNLTKRYITLLLNFDSNKQQNANIQNILALTFANKATVEMKERIIETLKKISLGMDVKDLTSDINLPKNKVVQNSLMAINTLLLNYDNFNVRTIDSFINLIIKACALKLGFSPNYRILNSYDEYIDYSIDSFLDKIVINSEVKSILNAFFNQFIIDGENSWNIKKYISNKFKEFYNKDISKNSIIFDFSVNYTEILNLLSKKFREVCSSMQKIKEYNDLDARFKKIIDKDINSSGTLFSLTSTYFQKENLPYKKDALRSELLNDLFEQAKQIIKDFVEIKSKHFYDNYLKMFKYIIDEFDNRTQKDSVLFLQDINRKVLDIFDQNTLVPEIYCRLSTNFKDFLIDEFQDTNTTQWETLKLIVEENLSQNGSFYYVGDKKQAIYGFRGSDFQIFDIPLKEFNIYGPQKLALVTNYRSCQAIVDFNNLVFSKENVKSLINYIIEQNEITNADRYCKPFIEVFSSSHQEIADNKKNLGYVEISFNEYIKNEDNVDEKVKEYLYKTIQELTKRFEYKDITILCRWGKEVEKIGKWLLEKNINIESFKTLNIINSNVVKDLFSALQFFNSPTDNIAFSSFITSSMFLKQTKLTKDEIQNFIFMNSYKEEKQQDILYVKFREKYLQIWDKYIEVFFNSIGFVAIYEFMISIISKFNVMENFKEESNIILRFLEVISDFESKDCGLQNFINYFKNYDENKSNEKFFIKVPSGNAIKIMTIHKAKGLQFNVVIMPYFYINKIIPDNPFYITKNNKFQFFNINKKYIPYSDKLRDIYYKSYFKILSDELNILYVASTRAIYEFYALILQPKKEENKKELINVFVKEDFRIIGKKQIYFNLKEAESDFKNFELQTASFEDITDIISESSVEIYGKKYDDMLLKGQIAHYALSLVETFDIKDLNTIVKEIINKVSIAYPNENFKILEKKLFDLLSNSTVYFFFDKSNEVFNEKEFVDKFGNTIRIDKLIIKKDTVYIVDFKNSLYDKVYIKEQIKNYRSVINDIYPDKKIKTFVVDISKNKVLEIT